MNKTEKAIRTALKLKPDINPGELYVNVSAYLEDKVDMKEFIAAYNEVTK